jgi:hypothetical protein
LNGYTREHERHIEPEKSYIHDIAETAEEGG